MNKKSRKNLLVQLILVTFVAENRYTMNKQDKLLKRFYNLPRDFTFDEMVSLFRQFDFRVQNKGTTSGSRIIFVNDNNGDSYIMHRPHPSNIIKGYVMHQVYNYLTAKGYIKSK